MAALLLRSCPSPPVSSKATSTCTAPAISTATCSSKIQQHGSSNGHRTRISTTRPVAYLSGSGASKIYKRMGSCLIIPPPEGRRPKAVIKFLGGAFVGAAPEVTYSYLMETLAKEGFFIVSVPYDVTFDHSRAAREVFERFLTCFDNLIAYGCPSANLESAELSNLPVFSVGHSNGALLQLLVGSYFSDRTPKANVIVSFNNRPASEAVPYFEQVGPLVSQVTPVMEATPLLSIATSASGGAWKALQDTAETLLQQYDQEAFVSLNKFVDQLPSVLNQVKEGVSEFRPTPLENRDFFRKSYNVPNTLLVKFSSDTIDETDILEGVLQPRVQSIGARLEKIVLPGNHLTPCIPDLKWPVGKFYTPADAIAQGLKSASLMETKALARNIADWFDRIIHE